MSGRFGGRSSERSGARDMAMDAGYTIEASTEWGSGQGVNGYGKRKKVSGFYVLNPQGRRIRGFTGNDAETKANEWAKFCNENLLKG